MTATERRSIAGTPRPKQRIFETAPANEKGFGGAAGGGKTNSLERSALKPVATIPGTRAVLIRKTTDDLQEIESDMKDFIPQGPQADGGLASFNENENIWTFYPARNPWCPQHKAYTSYLHLWHMVTTEAVRRAQGFQFGFIGVDEAALLHPDVMEYLKTRRRTPIPGAKQRGYPQLGWTSNPGGPGHQYLKDEYVAPLQTEVELLWYWDEEATGPDGRPGWWALFPPGARGEALPRINAPDERYGWWLRTDDKSNAPHQFVVWRPHPTVDLDRENAKRKLAGLPPRPMPSRVFIPALLEDNPTYYESDDYEATLLAIKDERIRHAMRYGDWDAFEGMFFNIFAPALHVIDPISPPSHWRKWGSMDWASGRDARIVYQWHTQNPQTEQVVTYREHSLRGDTTTDRNFAEDVLRLSQGEHVDYTLADPSMFHGGNRDNATTLAQDYHRYGLDLQPANNDRVQGWATWKGLMAVNPLTAAPGWVVTRNCVNLIRTMPMQTYADHNPNDMLKNEHDHDCDATRYGVMAKARILPRFTSPVKAHSYLKARG